MTTVLFSRLRLLLGLGAALTVARTAAAQAPPLGDRFAPVCIQPHVSQPGFSERVAANTEAADPAYYASLTAPGLGKVAADPKLGDVRVFNGFDYLSNSIRPVSARLMALGALSYLWVEEAELTNGHVTQADVDAMHNALEVQAPAGSKDPTKSILALDQQYFGAAPNRDGDGKVDVLIYDIKDGWTPGQGFVAGLFNSGDQYTKAQVATSNERDLIYIDTYPSITSPNRHSTSIVLQTLAHEYQHLIHFNYDRSETTFLNEAMSEYAEGICGYALREADDYLNAPNLRLIDWGTGIGGDVLADYARASLWASYVFDQLGDDQIRHLVQDRAVGVAAIDTLLKRSRSGLTVADLTHRFHLANWVSDVSTGSAYGYINPQRVAVKVPEAVAIDLTKALGTTNRILQNGGVEYLRLRDVRELYIRLKGRTVSNVLRVSAIYTDGGVTKVVPVGENQIFSLPAKVGGALYPEVVFVASGAGLDRFAGEIGYSIEQVTQPANAVTARPRVGLGVLRNTLVPEAFDFALLADRPLNVASSRITPVSSNGTLGGDLPLRASAGAASSLYLADGRRALDADGTYDIRLITSYVNGIVTLDTLYRAAVAIARVDANSARTARLGDAARVTLAAGSADGGAVVLSKLNPALEPDLGPAGYRVTWTGGSLRQPVTVTLGIPTEESTPLDRLTLARWTGTAWVSVPGATVDAVSRTVTGQVTELTAFRLGDRSALAVDEPAAPTAFRLLPAAPNPFNPTTAIRYQLSAVSPVKLQIFDALGRRVRTLVDETKAAGSHTAMFDAADLPSGMYLARLTAGGAVRTQKLTLTK